MIPYNTNIRYMKIIYNMLGIIHLFAYFWYILLSTSMERSISNRFVTSLADRSEKQLSAFSKHSQTSKALASKKYNKSSGSFKN